MLLSNGLMEETGTYKMGKERGENRMGWKQKRGIFHAAQVPIKGGDTLIASSSSSS